MPCRDQGDPPYVVQVAMLWRELPEILEGGERARAPRAALMAEWGAGRALNHLTLAASARESSTSCGQCCCFLSLPPLLLSIPLQKPGGPCGAGSLSGLHNLLHLKVGPESIPQSSLQWSRITGGAGRRVGGGAGWGGSPGGVYGLWGPLWGQRSHCQLQKAACSLHHPHHI